MCFEAATTAAAQVGNKLNIDSVRLFFIGFQVLCFATVGLAWITAKAVSNILVSARGQIPTGLCALTLN